MKPRIQTRETESIAVIADSELTISRQEGLKAEGFLSIIVWISIVFMITFFIYIFRDAIAERFFKIKHHIKKRRKRK